MAAPQPLAFDAIDPALQTMLRPTYDRLGYFGEFFGQAAHCPPVLDGFMTLSKALKEALPEDLNEVLALCICHHLDFPYERIQHERLAEKLGYSREWIGALVGRGGDDELTALQKTVRDCGLALADGDTAEAREATASIATSAGDGVAIAVLFQITRYMQVCLVGRTLDMQLPVASIFDSQS